MSKIILDLCGGTGAWSNPYLKAGYDVRLITLPVNDVRNWKPIPGPIHGILAAPPCEQLSIARMKHGYKKLDGAMTIVNACMQLIYGYKSRWWALENPVGKLTEFLGPPAFSFQPWWYGDPWCKRTMIWGNFMIPARQYQSWEDVPKIPELYTRPRRKRPSLAFNHKSHKQFIRSFDPFKADTDADFRAITPQGFAKAFQEANQ